MIEKSMLKDKWSIPVPAEYSQSIGLEKGGKVYIDLDKANDRIIVTSSPSKFEEKIYNDKEIIDLIKFIITDNAYIKSKLQATLVNKLDGNRYVPELQEECGHCGRPLQPHEKLIVNGKRICSNCKKIEVQKFLLYLERRKLNAKKEKEERDN